MKAGLALLAVLAVAACGSGPVVPDWQAGAHQALASYTGPISPAATGLPARSWLSPGGKWRAPAMRRPVAAVELRSAP